MADVVYLKKGERVLRSPSVVVIEVVSDRSKESIESGSSGLRIRVNASNFKSILADLRKKAGATSAQTIYVKGGKPER